MFTIEACTADQLDELRSAYFWADDTDHDELYNLGIWGPSEVPDWMLHREYARVLFTDDDFCCTAHR